MGKNPIELLAVVYEGVETCHSETTGGDVMHGSSTEPWPSGIWEFPN